MRIAHRDSSIHSLCFLTAESDTSVGANGVVTLLPQCHFEGGALTSCVQPPAAVAQYGITATVNAAMTVDTAVAA
jgi:hypothetical protein